MKTSGAIRTTFAPSQRLVGQVGQEEKRRCHARVATSRRIVTTIPDYVMVKTEDSSRVTTQREESLLQVLSRQF